MMTAENGDDYLKIDSRRLSIGEYRRSLGSGPRLWLALLLKLLRIRIDDQTAYSADARMRPLSEDDVPPGARLRLERRMAGLLDAGFMLVGYQRPHTLGWVTQTHSALLQASTDPVYATVVDIETQAGGNVQRSTFTHLFTPLADGRWLVTTSNPAAFDTPPGVEQHILGDVSSEKQVEAHRESLAGSEAAPALPAEAVLERYSRLLLDHGQRTGRLKPVEGDELERLRRRGELPPPTRRRAAAMSTGRSLLLWVVVFTLVIVIWNLLQTDSDWGGGEVVDLEQEPSAQTLICEPGGGLTGETRASNAILEASRRWLTVSARLPQSERASAAYDDLYLQLTTGGVFALEAPWERAEPLVDPEIRRRRRTFVAFEEARYREGVDQPLGCFAGLAALVGREPDLVRQGEQTAARQRQALTSLVAEEPSLDAELVELHVQWVTAGYGLDGSDWTRVRERWVELLGGDLVRFQEANREQLAVGGYVTRDGGLLNVNLWGDGTSELLPALADHLCRQGAATVYYRLDD